jgi:hypothetical protein
MLTRFFNVPICSTNLATGEVQTSRRFAIRGEAAAPDVLSSGLNFASRGIGKFHNARNINEKP